MKESRYNQLVKKNEQIKTEKDQLIGVYKEDKRRLRIEFDCSTIARGRRRGLHRCARRGRAPA